ncbi:MAG: metal ABC transporter substrate-binding protein [Treponema sp.]|nr:metal ABC transporter substrate-binding protein [Treponema sp.]
MKIRKIIIPAALIALALFSSCTPKKAILEDRIKIVNTVFPPYDWTSAIIGMDDSKTTNSLVAKNGLDMHNYQPSTSDIIQISSADIFIYIGGESDAWVKEALKNSTNPNMKILNLMEIIKEKDSLLSEEEDENEYDEHIWLSLRKAKICVEAISQALCEKVPELAENYKKNTDEYIEELDLLDASFKSVITSTPHNTLIFCDRFPFRYLTEDYGLNYSAAFDGCSAETEASFETVARLSKNLNESGVNAVLVLENSDKKIARTVIANAKKPKCDTLVLDSLQSTALHEAFNGKTYIGTMRENLGTIKKALE